MSNGPEYQDNELFKSLILNFQVTAWIGMGKIVNPLTQKAQRNLRDAQVAIDMLTMLAEKTKGNLLSDETSMLQQTLTDLRLNFIAEKDKPEPQPASEEQEQKQVETSEVPSEGASEKVESKSKKKKSKASSKKKLKRTKKKDS